LHSSVYHINMINATTRSVNVILSNTGEYALRAVIYLAEREGAGPVRVEDVARALGAPRNYLSKILHTLVKRGLLFSVRGPKGGFELAVSPGLVSLFEVVEAFDDVEARRRCLLGGHRCGAGSGCLVHDRWEGAATGVVEFFRETMVADVVGARRDRAPVGGH
jgi:Rrf2 family transcriptional regulator, iron-sulfur cluster assembly transcription factor